MNDAATITYNDMTLSLYWDASPTRMANMMKSSKYCILDAHTMLRYHKSTSIGEEYYKFNYDFSDPSAIVYSSTVWSSERTHGACVLPARTTLWTGHATEFISHFSNPDYYLAKIMREDIHFCEKYARRHHVLNRVKQSQGYWERARLYAHTIKTFEESMTYDRLLSKNS